MTNNEKEFILQTINLCNSFLHLNNMSSDDINDVRKAIHTIQHIVMKNEAKRNNPDLFNANNL